MSDGTAAFGALLRQLRTAASLSQEELAERAGLSVRGISDLERGLRQAPRLVTVRLLADGLALSDPDRAALLAAARPVLWREGVEDVPFPGARLPIPATPIVGREHEVATSVAMLRRSDVRLLTLTGPGGVGKTRLALESARSAAADFADGVTFVDLAPIRDPRLVLPTVAAALGVRDAGDRPVADRLRTYLADRQQLLVLDNFEQVLEAAPRLIDLLAACPALTLLVTSRAMLHVSGEHGYVVPPLALPERDPLPPIDWLSQSEAVRLFVARAEAADASFAVTTASAPAVAEICHRLDGLPLAIELAAARVRVFPPQALLARLEPRLPLLTGGERNQPARLQTMRGAIAWSYDLLPLAGQQLFRRLAVFVGGCTLEAVEAVGGVGAIDVIDDVSALVDSSLLRQTGSGARPRFRMLETVREYGLEHLAAAGEETEARERHAAWCLALAADAEPVFLQMLPDQAAWLVRLEAEHANLRAALAWFLDRGNPHLGLRLAAALWWFWHMRGHLSEGRSWLERALAAAPSAPPLDRAKAVFGACLLTHFQGNEQAFALGEESLALFRALDDRAGIGRALNLLGVVAEDRGEYDRAAALFAEALAMHREDNDRPWTAHALRHLGLVTCGQGDLEQAVALTEEALALYRELGVTWSVIVTLIYLGVVTCERGELQQSAAAYAEALVLATEQGARQGVARVLVGLATLAAFCKRPTPAARLFGAADVVCEALGYQFGLPERTQYERARSVARGALGDEAFAATLEAGRDLPDEQAIAEALALADEFVRDPR